MFKPTTVVIVLLDRGDKVTAVHRFIRRLFSRHIGDGLDGSLEMMRVEVRISIDFLLESKADKVEP